jgi:hypothetical protein
VKLEPRFFLEKAGDVLFWHAISFTEARRERICGFRGRRSFVITSRKASSLITICPATRRGCTALACTRRQSSTNLSGKHCLGCGLMETHFQPAFSGGLVWAGRWPV